MSKPKLLHIKGRGCSVTYHNSLLTKDLKASGLLTLASLIFLLVISNFTIPINFGLAITDFDYNSPDKAITTIANDFASSFSIDLSEYEWTQISGDSASSRFSAGPAPEAPDILWKTNITGIQSHLSVFNDKVYVCTHTTVYALDHSSGDILWSTVIAKPGNWPSVYKIDSNHLVVGNTCLNPETGEIIWVSDIFAATSAPLFTFNVYSPEEKMFFTKEGSFITGWNFSNPNQPPAPVWTTYISGSGITGSGIQYGDGKVFPGAFESHQMALDAGNGLVIWDTDTTGPMLFSGTYANGKFFRGGTHDNVFYAFDANNGKILWTFNPKTPDGYWCSGTAAAYGMVYAVNKDGSLYALDQDTGELVWKYTGPGSLMFPGAPTVADGKVYATTGQEAAYGGIEGFSEFACLDAFTGQVIWDLPIEAFAPRESVAIAYGTLYLIPGDVTQSVDSISGNEYSTVNQVWAMRTTSWSMYRHDAAHTAAGQSGPQNLTLRWSFKTSGSVISSPSLVDGIAYFGSQDKHIYAVNARDGSFIWKFVTQARIGSSPAVYNGKVYTGTDDGNVYCLNAYNGTGIWTAYTGGYVNANLAASVMLRSSPTIYNGHVYVGALDNRTYCINADTGVIRWYFNTSGYITSSPAVVDDAVYVSSQEPGSGALYKLNATNGEQIWKQSLPYFPTFMGGFDMHGSPTVADGMVFASSSTSAYYGIDVETGEKVWTVLDPSSEEFIICSTVYKDGVLYIINKFSIIALNAKTGDTLWGSFIGDELYVSPTYADGKLYIATDQRHLYVLNASNGERLSFYTFSSNSWSSPTVYEGKIYLGNNDWNVYCFSQYPALDSNITLGLSASQVSLGELVTGYGQLTPKIGNATLTLTLTNPHGASNKINVVTTENGEYSFTFTPQTEGNWTVTAQWIVDKSYYTSSVSEPVEISVSIPPTPTPTPTPIPTPEVTPSQSPSPTPTPTPWDQQTFAGIPLTYIYVAIIAILIGLIAITGSVYIRNMKTGKSSRN